MPVITAQSQIALQTEFQELWAGDNNRLLYDSVRFGVMVVASNRPRLMAHAVILPRFREAAEFVHFYLAPSAVRLSIHTLADHVAKKMFKSADSEQRALTYIGGFSESNHVHAHVYLAKENERTQFFDGESLGASGIRNTIDVVRFDDDEIKAIEKELEAVQAASGYL